MSWKVKMQHFGKDSLAIYSDEKFDISWEDRLNVFHRIYSKKYGKEMKVRKEIQEQPNKLLKEAFMDKLKDDNDDKTFSVGI